MNDIVNCIAPKPEAFNNSAPFTAATNPIFVQLKKAKNCAAKNTNIMYEPGASIDLLMPFIMSAYDLMLSDPMP